MSLVSVRGRNVDVIEAGRGDPLVYLHGFADVHGVASQFQPFHLHLAEQARIIAPAHPGCGETGELSGSYTIDDVLFHLLQFLDATGLDRFDLVGHCVGGWIAAELAVRHPERVKRLVLLGACGLYVPGEPIGDVFMHAQAQRGTDYSTLRALLFASAQAPMGLRFFPDGRGDLDEQVRRYQMLRFGSFLGFKPPYFYNRSLRERLYRAAMPSLVLWGEGDRLVPRAHGEVYVAELPKAATLSTVGGAGHASVLEQPKRASDIVSDFLTGSAVT